MIIGPHFWASNLLIRKQSCLDTPWQVIHAPLNGKYISHSRFNVCGLCQLTVPATVRLLVHWHGFKHLYLYTFQHVIFMVITWSLHLTWLLNYVSVFIFFLGLCHFSIIYYSAKYPYVACLVHSNYWRILWCMSFHDVSLVT